ncbi:nuclear transport factor 2 family protein [Tumidithrix elongata RA019]|uniref:Nuclear transport factor 2 family protein n=1 Tax=Tumidithrix elongata BACA0141 TaxID=2716417 RepID=A0AAW9PVQ8_9CYAN|nr:nuclear transport factor 2 family protein [Tumidithrix elongata RA019]
MTTVLDQYFQLTDRANFDEAAFDELVDLFAEQAEVQPAGGSKVKGKQAITQLYRMFFQMYSAMQHVWTTQVTDNGVQAAWAIAGRRQDGEMFAMQGIHVVELDAHGKIQALEVRVNDSESNSH